MSRDFCRAFAAALGLGVVVTTAGAQTTFHPAVSVEIAHSDNVAFLSGAEAPSPDWFTRVGVLLPVRRQGPRGFWELSYNPSYLKYREFTVFDNLDHRFGFNAEARPDRRSAWDFTASWTKSQTQGDPGSTAARDQYLTPRADSTSAEAGVAYRREATERWGWNAAVHGAAVRYSPIAGYDPAVPTAVLEDRNEYRGVLGFERLLSRATFAGAEYRFERYELSVSGAEDDHFLSLTARHRFGRDVTMNFRLGAFHRQAPSAEGAAAIEGFQSNGLQGHVDLERSLREQSLSFEADHGPTAGGAFAGTSTDSTAAVRWRGWRGERFRWESAARYARREPTDATQPTVYSSGLGGSVEWIPGPKFGVTLGGDYVRQTGTGTPLLDGSFTTVRLGVTWYPRSVQRPGGGGAI